MDTLRSSSMFDIGDFTKSDEELKGFLEKLFTIGITSGRINYKILGFRNMKDISIDRTHTFVDLRREKFHDTQYIHVSFKHNVPGGISKDAAIDQVFQLIKESWNECKPDFKCINKSKLRLRSLYITGAYQGNKHVFGASVRDESEVYIYHNENAPHTLVNQYVDLRKEGDIAASKNLLLDFLNGKEFRHIMGGSKIIFKSQDFEFVNI